MNTNDNLKLEIPKLFYPAFKKAVEYCNSMEKNMTVLKKEIPGENKFIIEVATDKPEDFFYLGKAYSLFRQEI